MTREEARKTIHDFMGWFKKDKPMYEALDMAIKALSAEPCREADDYENEIADLQNRLDIAEYDRDRWKEIVTVLEEKLKSLSAEPCEDCVSRAEALKNLALTNNKDDVYRMLTRLSPVTTKQKMGRWINDRCSECGKGIEDLIVCPEWYRDEQPNFCPFCGVKLVDPQESEDEIVSLEFSEDIDTPGKYQTKDGVWHTATF